MFNNTTHSPIATAVLLVSCLTAGAAAQPGPAAPDQNVLPADNAVAGWVKDGRPRVFTKADLYGHINGGAELFLEMGFDQLTVQKYREGARGVVVELYRMTDATAAHAIYLAKRGREVRDAALKERHTVSRHQLTMQRGRYYVVVNNLAGEAAVQPVLVRLAAAIALRLPPDTAVPALALLPAAGLRAESVRIVRGPVSLQDVYTLGDGDVLQLNGRVTAVSGEVEDPARGRHLLVVVPYASADQARAAFRNLRQRLDSELKVTKDGPERFDFRDFEDLYGVVAVTGSRMEIRLRLKQP